MTSLSGGMYGTGGAPVKGYFVDRGRGTLPPVSGDRDDAIAEELGAALQTALVGRLKAIPDGLVSETARRAGLDLRQLLRLRAGGNTDVKLSTLAKLAIGLGEQPAAIIATKVSVQTAPSTEPPPIDPRLVRRAVKLFREMAATFDALDAASKRHERRKP